MPPTMAKIPSTAKVTSDTRQAEPQGVYKLAWVLPSVFSLLSRREVAWGALLWELGRWWSIIGLQLSSGSDTKADITPTCGLG